MPSSSARRAPLSRSSVLRAGIALADAEGLGAVTMRNLAERLGVVPMALYKHVADKEDLLDGMVDTLIADLPVPPSLAPGQWRPAVTEVLSAARAAINRHPWARRAIETRTGRTPAVLGHMERLSGIFLAAGFSPDLTHHVMHLLGNRIWGFSPELFPASDDSYGQRGASRRRTTPALDPEDYPSIMAIVSDARARHPDAEGCDEDFEYDFALGVLLDGIAGLHASGWTSPARAPNVQRRQRP